MILIDENENTPYIGGNRLAFRNYGVSGQYVIDILRTRRAIDTS
nr:MAG TPA: hypothetical protein [Caudoviricetes sp.]